MNTKPENLRIVGVFAHPDDEGFGSGGTLAMLSSRGHSITIVCATNGDVGEISDLDLATPETLGRVRKSELFSAMNAMGNTILGFSITEILGCKARKTISTPMP